MIQAVSIDETLLLGAAKQSFPLESSRPLQEASATNQPKDEITIKTPILKGRLFLKTWAVKGFGGSFYMSEAPSPLLHTVKYISLYLLTQGREDI